ncbi:MAG TPA: 4-hydroxy-tetrahydrodipicolinate reductase [Bacteroidales bacterium]|nr:4-hydroxy-tetrahydrodipicolinate reductase [Bacteroidales bacterium]
MMKIVISGYGKMGREIFSILQEQGDTSFFTTDDICGFDRATASESVCIDFTTPGAFRGNYRFIADSFRAAVIGTTGWSDIKEEVTGYFREKGTTMIYASNFSIGVNIFFEIARISSALLGSAGEYDPYISELHHKFKLDSPSGTAGTLRQIVEDETGMQCPVQSVRCGHIPGTHHVGFESVSDRIVLTHEAFSRRGFAAGAIQAAYWTPELQGVFDFREILREKLIKI